jgi:hypothetical protein
MHISNLTIQHRTQSYTYKYIQSPFPFQYIEYEDTYQKTRVREVTGERGVCFHPTIGTTTPERIYHWPPLS